MMVKTLTQKWWFRIAIVFGCWLIVALLFAGQNYAYRLYTDAPLTWRQAALYPLGDSLTWAALTLPILWLAERFPLEQRRSLQRLAFYFALGLAFSLLKILLDVWTVPLFGNRQMSSTPKPALFRSFLFARLHSNLITCWVLFGISQTLAYYQKYRERTLRASQLEAKLAQAQLQMLKMQLQPHFLFNTLHAISTLMHRDVEIADRMLARLSDLLRLTLENVGVQEVTLKQELDFLERYLEIEQTRFQDRLTIHKSIAPETLDATVPTLLLQPLVENAVKYAIAPRSAAGCIEIKAWRNNGMLELEIRDNGPGLPQNGAIKLKEGVGLSNTRARLEQLCGSSHRFELRNAAEGGLVVSLAMPFRELSETPA